MAVSKALRFSVLSRDGFTCRYCGAKAPDVPLHVDHVVPVALGGADAPENLVTACAPCNSGKASSNLDAATVADIRADALHYARLVEEAYAVIKNDIYGAEDYVEEFLTEWARAGLSGDELATDYVATLTRWRSLGVPVEVVTNAVRLAAGVPYVRKADGRFRYAATIVWRTIEEVGVAVQSVSDLVLSHFMDESTLSSVRIDAWTAGYRAGAGIEGENDGA